MEIDYFIIYLDILMVPSMHFFVPGKELFIEVNSESVSGNMHDNLTMTWTVKKLESDIVASAVLVLGKSTSGQALFEGVHNPLNKRPASRMFGGRIDANWDGPNFTIHLQNLQCSDTVSFTLVVSVSGEDYVTDRGKANRTITIIKVNGKNVLFEHLYHVSMYGTLF